MPSEIVLFHLKRKKKEYTISDGLNAVRNSLVPFEKKKRNTLFPTAILAKELYGGWKLATAKIVLVAYVICGCVLLLIGFYVVGLLQAGIIEPSLNIHLPREVVLIELLMSINPGHLWSICCPFRASLRFLILKIFF